MSTATRPEIEFDEVAHTYKVEGRELISVTQVLKEAGLVTEYSYSEEALTRGRAIHLACQFSDEGDLDLETLNPEWVGYVQAWEKFKNETGFKVLLSEHKVAHLTYGYAGRLDRQGIFNAKKRDTILDIKTGAIQPETALQLAAYGEAYLPGKLWDRVAVGLKPDGNYSLKVYPPATFQADLHDFLACCRIAVWKRRHHDGNSSNGS